MFRHICRIGLPIVLVFFALLNPPPAIAEQDASGSADSSDARTYFLKGTVVTANRYEQRPFDVSQPITVFSPEDIRGLSPAIVSDLFRNVPGVEINDAGPFRTRPVIRGVFGNRVLVLIDGERLNNTRQSSPAGAQLSLVDVGQVERVETLYGPGAVLYGSDALGGVINIITKSPTTESAPESFKPHGTAEVRYSTVDEQKKGRLELGGEYKRLSFLAGGSVREASDYESAEGPVVNSGLGEESNLDLKLKYGLTDEYDLSADFQRFRAKDIGYPGTPNPPDFPPRFFFPYHDRDKLVISSEGNNLSPRLAKLKGKLYYQRFSKDFETELTMPIGPTMSLYSFSQTLTDVETYGFSFQELFVTAKNQHLTWGVDFYREVID
ncbi:MAG: TonB-dependent receptor plug domain-containing protein, partial [Candidatus Zixiibacteriota bacterium]